MAEYFDRYNKFRGDGGMKPIIGVRIPNSGSDKQAIYKQGLTRLDKLSQKYYNNPYSGWLIMLANPEYGGLEFNIPDTALIKIPYPYEDGLNRYSNEVTKHNKLYGK